MSREKLLNRFAAYATVALAGISGGGSLLLFAIFLFSGPPIMIDIGPGRGRALCLDAGLSLAFFIQHSGMVRRPFRNLLARFVPVEFAGAFYSIASGLVLSAVVVFWQEDSPLFMAPPGALRWAFHALYVLSSLGFLWAGLSLKSFDPFGVSPILRNLRGAEPERMPFTVRGPYRMIRHPLYLFSILMIWSCPDQTTDRLLFNVTWTCWIIVGAHFEERDLINEFGDAYRQYQRTVPMLFPRRIR